MLHSKLFTCNYMVDEVAFIIYLFESKALLMLYHHLHLPMNMCDKNMLWNDIKLQSFSCPLVRF